MIAQTTAVENNVEIELFGKTANQLFEIAFDVDDAELLFTRSRRDPAPEPLAGVKLAPPSVLRCSVGSIPLFRSSHAPFLHACRRNMRSISDTASSFTGS